MQFPMDGLEHAKMGTLQTFEVRFRVCGTQHTFSTPQPVRTRGSDGIGQRRVTTLL